MKDQKFTTEELRQLLDSRRQEATEINCSDQKYPVYGNGYADGIRETVTKIEELIEG